MSTYVIGDIQGCFDELQTLLHDIRFNPQQDRLWLTGDLVNRGPQSLDVLRFVKKIPNVKTVLGNHDLTLLAYAYSDVIKKPLPDLDPILNADDKEDLLEWLRQQSLLYFDSHFKCALVHAGILPNWTLEQTKTYAKEVETVLQGNDFKLFLPHLYGDKPTQWNQNLTGWERLRFITNVFTRIRFCDAEGTLILHEKGKLGSQPSGFLPWFQIPHRATQTIQILFGHWAALDGKTNDPNVIALDTGCVWGRRLTAFRLDDHQFFSIPCNRFKVRKL